MFPFQCGKDQKLGMGDALLFKDRDYPQRGVHPFFPKYLWLAEESLGEKRQHDHDSNLESWCPKIHSYSKSKPFPSCHFKSLCIGKEPCSAVETETWLQWLKNTRLILSHSRNKELGVKPKLAWWLHRVFRILGFFYFSAPPSMMCDFHPQCHLLLQRWAAGAPTIIFTTQTQ